MSKKETKMYNFGFKEGTEDIAKKFGMIKTGPPEPNNEAKPPSQIEQILTGWGNYIKSHFVSLAPELQAEGQRRLEICHSCAMRDRGTCSTQRQARHLKTGEMTRGCGCRLAAKALSPGSVCPIGKW
tara:strand:+ start:1046 stop:1426 length:381 start_codon:yes stop_codon:yes gene_type:complete